MGLVRNLNIAMANFKRLRAVRNPCSNNQHGAALDNIDAWNRNGLSATFAAGQNIAIAGDRIIGGVRFGSR